ncbi:MAG: response regulator [Lachnospiraceae bacterium]|nr:response regulator [Lachnospiraceae bacterium]
MYTKIIYVLVDSLAIVIMFFTIMASMQIRQRYGVILKKAFICSIVAIFSNILIAVSFNEVFAGIVYSLYFAAIDWMLLYLTGFCLAYTDHNKALKILRPIATTMVWIDSISILLNYFFGHVFNVYGYDYAGTVFYQTEFKTPYFVHLGIDYLAVVITFGFIIYRIVKSYDVYRTKYVMILSVLLLVVFLNVLYMAFSLILDISVVFYAVAGPLICFGIMRLVPRNLMSHSIAKAVNDMNEGLVLFDVGNGYIFSNKYFNEQFGPIDEDNAYSAEPMSSIRNSLMLKGKLFGPAEYERSDSEGRLEHYQVLYNQLLDRKNRPIGSYLLVENDTEEISYLRQLDDARREADEANRAKSTFLANMSHEIRTPLNAVLGMNEMILRKAEDPDLLEYAENIRSSGNALLHLINDILDFSKIEACKMELIVGEYKPHDLMRECISRFEKMADDKDLMLKAAFDPNIPSVLEGDAQHLTQIISNMVSNAIKYTREGSVELIFSEGERPIAKGEFGLMIEVRDTGMGIAKEDLPYLFDAFERVNEKENANIQGTGLGLAITKQLAELMNGSVSVESEPGVGTVFKVYVSQKIKDATPAGEFERNVRTEHEVYHETFRAPNAHVLVVDDVAVNIMVIKELLKKTEVVFDKANSGDEAIVKCKEQKYDLILLDHRMPKKDGIETFREISADGLNQGTPVIMLTANAEAGARDEYRKIGFVDYLTKPVDSAELERALADHLPAELIEKV